MVEESEEAQVCYDKRTVNLAFRNHMSHLNADKCIEASPHRYQLILLKKRTMTHLRIEHMGPLKTGGNIVGKQRAAVREVM